MIVDFNSRIYRRFIWIIYRYMEIYIKEDRKVFLSYLLIVIYFWLRNNNKRRILYWKD